MLASDAKGMSVVSTATAETVGKVHEVVVDPTVRRVVALRLRKTPGDADLLAWADIKAFGADAVTVPQASVLQSPASQLAVLGDKHHAVLGKRVLTESGDALGEVEDVEFDPADGSVISLRTPGVKVAGSRLVSIGSYAAVVRDG